MTSPEDWDPYYPFYDKNEHTAKLQHDCWRIQTMPFWTVNNVSILLKHLPSKEDLQHLVHYIHQASASYKALCGVNPDLKNHIFGDLISDNTPNYTFNEAESDPGRVAVASPLTSNKHSGIDVGDLASALVVRRDTDLRTLEYTIQQGVRRSNFSLGERCLRSRHGRLHYKRFHDRFYSDTTYVRPKLQGFTGTLALIFSH